MLIPAIIYPRIKDNIFNFKPNNRPVLKNNLISPPPIPPAVKYEIRNIIPLINNAPDTRLKIEISGYVKNDTNDNKIIITDSLSGIYLYFKSIPAATIRIHINKHIITECKVALKTM